MTTGISSNTSPNVLPAVDGLAVADVLLVLDVVADSETDLDGGRGDIEIDVVLDSETDTDSGGGDMEIDDV